MSHVVFLNDPQGRFAELSRTARNLDAAADAKRRTAQAKAAKVEQAKAAKLAADRAAAKQRADVARHVARMEETFRQQPAASPPQPTAEQRRERSKAVWDKVLADRTRP